MIRLIPSSNFAGSLIRSGSVHIPRSSSCLLYTSQSFAPGEVTPEQAHAIGVELAQRLLADKYEVVVSTHLNKAHLHSHIVFNSVSFVDGTMYRDRIADLLGGSGVGIRGTDVYKRQV